MVKIMINYSKQFNKRIAIQLAIKYAAAILLILFFVFPYVFMINKSLMSAAEIASGNITFFPTMATLTSYSIVNKFWSSILNTLLLIFINGLFIPLTACIVAFPLSRHKFIGKKFMFAFIMSTVMIPSTVLMVPQYILYSNFGLVDNLASQYIGAFWGGGAINIFLVIQFMRAIPKDIDNAAKIDGANPFVIFVRIIFPLCFNIFLFICINTVMASWMDFQGPLLYLQSESKYTVGLAFYFFYSTSSNTDLIQNQLMAMCFVMTLLPMVLFLCFQKNMIGGVKMGGLKG